jgi:hypothetical protein
MMQFYMGDLLLLGITARNLEKLKEGQPIYFEPRGKEKITKIAIMYGEDKTTILKELEKTGMQIPHWMWDSANKSPI